MSLAFTHVAKRVFLLTKEMGVRVARYNIGFFSTLKVRLEKVRVILQVQIGTDDKDIIETLILVCTSNLLKNAEPILNKVI